MNSAPVLQMSALKKHYPVKKLFRTVGSVKALSTIDLKLYPGETLAVVGESGCGKSTLARLLMRLEPPTEGKIQLGQNDIQNLTRKEILSEMQMIFQDPYGSLNPRKKAWEIIAEPLLVNSQLSRQECRKRAEQIMVKVGLRPELSNRYPHMFSGGQRQRIGIARALIMQPQILVCDEPLSALDVSVQAQILNLLIDLQKELALSYILISHDLSVVRHIADRIAVIYLGRIVEVGTVEDIFGAPQHPYTKCLLESTPTLSKGKGSPKTIDGELPSPLNPPQGCAFHPRCPIAEEQCRKERPTLLGSDNHASACHLVS